MQSNNQRILILFSIAAIFLLIFFFFINSSLFSGKAQINWQETYDHNSREPYGTALVHDLLENLFPAHPLLNIETKLKNTLTKDSIQTGNYVFIGAATKIDTTEINHLLDFVEKGGRAFFSSKSIPIELINHFFIYSCDGYEWMDYSYYYSNHIRLDFEHPDLQLDSAIRYNYLREDKLISSRWSNINSDFFCEAENDLVALGNIDGHPAHFAQINFGKGHIYLHTVPLAFTNIQIIDSLGLTYVENAFSHLQEGPIYWDAYSHTSEFVSRSRNGLSRDEQEANPGPLKYILAQTSLRWAWYLMLVMALLYVIFRAKRKQRIIPVLPKNRNTSLEFTSTIGQLYFLQNNHRNLTLEMMKLLLADIRDRYHLSTQELNEEFVQKLAYKSELPENFYEKIFNYYNNINSSRFVSEKTMVEFHQMISTFYKKRK